MNTRIDPVRDIDWSEDFVWVQRVPVLTILEQSAGWFHVRHPAGGEITLSRSAVEAEYLPTQGGAMLEPRHAPIKAHRARVETNVALACGTVRLAPGDVLLNYDGRFSVVRAAVYDRDYVVVATRLGSHASEARLLSARA